MSAGESGNNSSETSPPKGGTNPAQHPPEDGAGAPEGAQDKTRVIFDRDRPDARVIISETLDRYRAYLTILRHSAEDFYSVAEIKDIAGELGIAAVLDEEAIQAALARRPEGSGAAPPPVLICEEAGPGRGEDGSVEVLYNRDDPFVKRGDLLVRVKPGALGKAGKDIYGNVITPLSGKTPEITLGKNVSERERNFFYSDAFGRAVFEAGFLAVHKVLKTAVSEDALTVRLFYKGKQPLTREIVAEELQALGIVHGIDDAAIDGCIAASAAGETPVEAVIASGTPARKGSDGKITYFFATDRHPHFVEKADGSVDMRETHKIQSVAEGALIAEVTPHVEPVPGRDVFGNALAVGKVKKVTLRAAKNVRVSENGLQFYAEAGGRPELDGDRVSVNKVLVIPGNLNMDTGNVDFDGEVQISGDVEDGYTVSASGSIHIGGFVGASNIQAGLDLTIDGGCNGHGKSRLLSGRTIIASFIDEVQVQASGDVRIKNELINSSVRSLGRVQVTGRICGGKVSAKKGIEAVDIGSQAGLLTRLLPGHDYELKEQCRTIDDGIARKKGEQEKIRSMIAPLLKRKDVLGKLPADKRSKFEETLHYLETLTDEIASLETCRHELFVERLADAIPEVVVYRYLYPGTVIKAGFLRREIPSLLEGPLRLYEDKATETVAIEPYASRGDRASGQRAAAAPSSQPAANMLKTYSESGTTCRVTFVLPAAAAGKAKTVCVVGDFNKWNKSADAMRKNQDGSFLLTLELETGHEYQFRYLIDGTTWENDWQADKYVRSPVGDCDNSVAVV